MSQPNTFSTEEPLEDAERIDLAAHGEQAAAEYLKLQPFYRDMATALRRILEEALGQRQIKVHSVQSREKDARSFANKAATPLDGSPDKPQYTDPLTQITDLAGVRIITYFPGTLREVDEVIRAEFNVLEFTDKGKALIAEERLGYQSVHYLVEIDDSRAQLPEYARFKNRVAEIQVRTILQHAWAEIEHDIEYKSVAVIPTDIRRRFIALAGLFEIADREFQAIQEQDEALRTNARTKVKQGQFHGVEITPDALRTYLDRKLGEDRRIADWTYGWAARLARRVGFSTIQQLNDAIGGLDDDLLSRLATGKRQGQTTRFELMLLAALGEKYIDRHFWKHHSWWGSNERRWLEGFDRAGIQTGSFDPLDEPESSDDSDRG